MGNEKEKKVIQKIHFLGNLVLKLVFFFLTLTTYFIIVFCTKVTSKMVLNRALGSFFFHSDSNHSSSCPEILQCYVNMVFSDLVFTSVTAFVQTRLFSV